jgi:hypothetical protein
LSSLSAKDTKSAEISGKNLVKVKISAGSNNGKNLVDFKINPPIVIAV